MKIKITQNIEEGKPGGYLVSTGDGIKYKKLRFNRVNDEAISFDNDRTQGNQTKFLLILDKGETNE